MKNALLFRLGGLGDLLVALPAISLVRKTFPSTRLTLVCREEYGALLQGAGVVDRLIREDSLTLLPLLSSSAAPAAELSEWLGGFDLIMGWMHGGKKDTLEESLAAASIPGEVRIFYYPARSSEQISRFFFHQTSEALIKRQPSSFTFEECAQLPPAPLKMEGGRQTKDKPEGKFVIMHPGSGSEKKCWPLHRFLEIGERLGEKEIKGALVTGETEIKIKALIERTSLPPGWSWLHFPSLHTLSGLLQETDLYLGNDSGITHLAAACGTEIVALFRKEFVPAWLPYGRVHLLSAGSLEEISVEAVWKTVLGALRLSEIPF
jgi:ADP-heptose:LPS heptosyltransferase